MSRRQSNRKKRPPSARHYPRTARLNTLLQQIVAEHLDRVDDERLPLVTVTGTEVDADLNRCDVYISTFEEPDPSRDAQVLEILGEQRIPLQSAIAREAKLRKTPEVVIQFDPAIRTGARVDSILASLGLAGADETDPPGPDAAAPDAAAPESSTGDG